MDIAKNLKVSQRGSRVDAPGSSLQHPRPAQIRNGWCKCAKGTPPRAPTRTHYEPKVARCTNAAAETTRPEFPHQRDALSPQPPERAEGLTAARRSDLNVKRNPVKLTVWKEQAGCCCCCCCWFLSPESEAAASSSGSDRLRSTEAQAGAVRSGWPGTSDARQLRMCNVLGSSC